ncbi:MAG TPA: DUF5320 domain-containing protein [Candidatus Desulfaltia sp.]|nr:DUF5320 domain-containing protein [Candidatus Desulfaltia sp.]
MMHRHHGCHGAYHCGCHGVMSVEEEVQMLEKVKEHLEAQMANVNERLAKLKE